MDHPPDTLGLTVVSNPSMFDRTFVPYLLSSSNLEELGDDPLDKCMRLTFDKIADQLGDLVPRGDHHTKLHLKSNAP